MSSNLHFVCGLLCSLPPSRISHASEVIRYLLLKWPPGQAMAPLTPALRSLMEAVLLPARHCPSLSDRAHLQLLDVAALLLLLDSSLLSQLTEGGRCLSLDPKCWCCACYRCDAMISHTHMRGGACRCAHGEWPGHCRNSLH